MPLNIVAPPYPVFTDRDGTPLENGYVYLGVPGQDAETNPIQVFWDESLTIPAPQPIRTVYGYLSRNGTPAKLYANRTFSITVKNVNQEVVFSSLSNVVSDPTAGRVDVETFTGDGTTTQFTMTAPPITENNTQVYINGVYQNKDGYSLSGAVLTFSEAPPAVGSHIEVVSIENLVIGEADSSNVQYIPSAGVVTTVQAKLRETVSVKDFGAVGDGVTDDTAAIQAAVDYADSNLLTIKFPAGVYCISSTINVSVNPVGFVGEYDAIWQQGSTLPSVTLRWTGGASSMFNLAVSNVYFEGMAVENTGAATDFVSLGVIRYRFKRLSFLVRSGATAFSRSIIYALGNRLGYSEFSGVQVGGGAAPYFIYIDGNGTANGCTPISFSDRCVFESGSSSPLTVLYIKDEVFDSISIDNCTFNQQGGELTIIDTTDSPLAETIRSLTLTNIEWDYSVANDTATDNALKLENVQNITIVGGNWQCGGVTSCISLTNCTVADVSGNYIRSVATFITADSNSVVNIGYNDTDITNVQRILNDGANGYYSVAWTTGNVFVNLQNLPANKHGVLLIDVTGAGAWNIAFRNGSNGYKVSGQVFTLRIKNTSGGVINAPTVNADTKLSAAIVVPADGYSRSYTFMIDGSDVVELNRSAADVPN